MGVPDPLFDALWRLPGGPELLALHGAMEGAVVPVAELREALGLAREEFEAVLAAGREAELCEADGERVTLRALAPGSPPRARLDGALEERKDEVAAVSARLHSLLLLRFFGLPPKAA